MSWLLIMLKAVWVCSVTLCFISCSDAANNRTAGFLGDSARQDSGPLQNDISTDKALNRLVNRTALAVGNEHCLHSGVRIDRGKDANGNSLLDTQEILETQFLCNPSTENPRKHFNRLASFAVCGQLGSDCDTDTVTAAEIVAVSADGMTLVYTDGPASQLGFVDITAPANPVGLGALAMGGEPTSVAVKGGYALVGVNGSANYVDVAGSLVVVDIAAQKVVRSMDLGGQPDSIAVSPDGAYAAVVVENERDEGLDAGTPPQAPAGYLVVVNTQGPVSGWHTTEVDLTGLATLYPGDPEPEYVDINRLNRAVVTLQENNHIVLVDLPSAQVVEHFSAGTVSLTQIDTEEELPALISLNSNQSHVLREPDGVAWIDNHYFATADEGDLSGGGRTFTVFNLAGEVVYSSGLSLEHGAVRFGHYPDSRSGNKGGEPENVEVGIFDGHRYMFVNAERANLIFVYDAADPTNPVYRQALPTARGPEGVLAIPARNLLIAASEVDSRPGNSRSTLNIYGYTDSPPEYPTLVSVNRADDTPIPWGAISGLAASPTDDNILYAVDDSYFQRNRIFVIDVAEFPAKIIREIPITDTNSVFSAIPTVALAEANLAPSNDARRAVFDSADLALLINGDKTLNIDPEGIAVASDGGFWLASEGSGTSGDAEQPINALNWLFKIDSNGVIEQVFTLPDTLNAQQQRFGFEGVTEYQGKVYVAMQRPWSREKGARIAVLDPMKNTWEFYFYPLQGAARGWLGLSAITSLGNGQFLVLERDNQAGPDAKIKRLYGFNLTGLNDGDTVTKTLVRDLLPELKAPGGLIYEKIEGLTVTKGGQVYTVNDNDGVKGNSGETQLLKLGL